MPDDRQCHRVYRGTGVDSSIDDPKWEVGSQNGPVVYLGERRGGFASGAQMDWEDLGVLKGVYPCNYHRLAAALTLVIQTSATSAESMMGHMCERWALRERFPRAAPALASLGAEGLPLFTPKSIFTLCSAQTTSSHARHEHGHVKYSSISI
jgi:hypothetical protein